MANYLLVYHGGDTMADATAEQQQEVIAAWMGWFGAMGSAVVDGGNPVGQSWLVTGDSVQKSAPVNAATGYSVISADSIEAAAEWARKCPHLLTGGTVEVCETYNVGP